MTKKTAQDKNDTAFVGRESKVIEQMYNAIQDKKILLVVGSGDGIGKTVLTKRLLLDIYHSENKNTELFSAETEKTREEQIEIFQKMLASSSENKPLVLAFDTFERLSDSSLDWLFDNTPIKDTVKKVVNKKSHGITIVFEPINSFSTIELTPKNLAKIISPYLDAIEGIQSLIDEIKNKPFDEIKINSITQNSPISVNLEGAPEAVKLVQENIIPWRRKHAEVMANFSEQEKVTEIESKKAEILEKRANAAKGRAEAEKITAEAAIQREGAEKVKLENEKLRLELQRQKIQLALEVLDKLSPHLPDTERAIYLIKLLPHLNIILESSVEITQIKKNSG
jgi:hypothetical protein